MTISKIQLRRGTAAAWTAANPVLDVAETGFETDTKRKKTGDGATAWNSLAYNFDDTAAKATYLTVVAHGATAGTARPAGAARVLWIGTVEPTNDTANDLYLDSATPTLYSSVGGTMTALGGGGLTTEQIQDIVGAMVSGGTETNISVTYDDTNGRLDFVATGVTLPNTADATLYVSGTGSDSNDGLTAGTPKRTLQAAYTALPSAGGTLFAAPGRYDTAAGWNLSRGKPVQILGTVKPPPYINSATTAPLSVNAAIIYTSTGAASMITTTGGTAGNQLNGLVFKDLVFEFSQSTTLTGIFANTVNYGRVEGCQFFADKTSGSPGPAAVTAVGVRVSAVVGTYGGDDASWWRIVDNKCMNMALCVMGNDTGTKYNSNQHVIKDNVGLGLTHTNTSTLPFISIYGGHRDVVRDNNIEAYYRGVFMDTCWMCIEDGDGGEFVDFFVDLVNCKGIRVSPLGMSYAGLGNNSATTPLLQDAKLVRGDSSTKACILILPSTWTTANTQRMYQPTNDGSHPAIAMSATDNVIISSRNSSNQGSYDLFGNGSPEGVETAVISSVYRRLDGGASTSLYVKESGTGNTGWVAYGAGGGGGSSPDARVARTADATAITSSTTLTADSVLKFALGASEARYFDARLLISAANGTMDLKIGLSGPASFSASWGNGDIAGSTANPGFFSVSTATTPSGALGAAGVITLGSAAQQLMVHVSGWVFGGGTAGDVALTFAQNTSDAGALQVKKGSFIDHGLAGS